VVDVIGRGDYVAEFVLDRMEVADAAQVTEATIRNRYQERLKAIGLYN
jgi:transcription initiation factor TFIIIB Brf1 subunit/transcription initiation factor TFIIB